VIGSGVVIYIEIFAGFVAFLSRSGFLPQRERRWGHVVAILSLDGVYTNGVGVSRGGATPPQYNSNQYTRLQ